MVRWAFEGLSGSWRAMQSVTLQKYHLGTNQLRFSTNRIRTPVDHSQCVFGGASRILNGKYSTDRAIQDTFLNPKLLTTISTFPQLCNQAVLSSYFAEVGLEVYSRGDVTSRTSLCHCATTVLQKVLKR